MQEDVTMDVKQDTVNTVKPIAKRNIEKGSKVYTDEYYVYDFLEREGYFHSMKVLPAMKVLPESVNHSAVLVNMYVVMFLLVI